MSRIDIPRSSRLHPLMTGTVPPRPESAPVMLHTEITELAGSDLLTISPDLLAKLAESNEPLTKKLDVANAQSQNIQRLPLDEREAVDRHLREYDRLGDDLRVIERELARGALAAL